MASGLIGNEVPRKGLRVRVPCPPLTENARKQCFRAFSKIIRHIVELLNAKFRNTR